MKTKEEFNLDNELIWVESLEENVILESRIREFLKRLKEELGYAGNYDTLNLRKIRIMVLNKIDILAGKKLK